MLCSNCGKNEANVRYTRIINGEKTEFRLCEECAKKAGLEDIDFSMPIDFSNFLSDFFEDDMLLPSFTDIEPKKCPKCGLTFDDFAKNGRFGCGECYSTFGDKLEAILKNLHGSSKHVGKKPERLLKANIEKDANKVEKPKVDEKQAKLEELNKDLQKAIKEERYEDAAKIRDQIKSIK